MKYQASKKTVISWLVLSILPAIMAYITFNVGDKGSIIYSVFFEINMIAFGVFIFFGIIAPIFLTAVYRVLPEFMQKNINGHVLSRFFIIKSETER